MRRFLLCFFVFVGIGDFTLYANEIYRKIEITASSISATKTTVTAKGKVLVYYKGAVITSDTVLYDKMKKLLILDGHIEMLGYNGSKEHAKHMEIYTQKNEVKFDALFLSGSNDIWLFSKHAYKKEKHYSLTKSVMSSCEVSNPLWKMIFSKSDYNVDTQYMKLYDATVYLKNIPIFYSPYLAFSTNRQRASGLLFPLLGYSNLEGFVYEQPIYWAISKSMDLEINPQIRTGRSLGGYMTFRFVDSNHSSGYVRVGYFKDTPQYVQNNHLPNNSHFGFEFYYRSSQLLSTYIGHDFTDGLYVNSTFLNDIDYLNLQKNRLHDFGLTPLQESRLNYFIHNNDYYFGLNSKYFIDTRTNVNKDETIQILPSIQWHRYLDYIIWENLTYSTDIKVNNFERKKGTTMRQVEMQLPLEWTGSFFNDFLQFSLGETFYYSKFFFGNTNVTYGNFEYFSTIHTMKIFTDLTKHYDGFIHVLQPSLLYKKPGSESQKPVSFTQLDVSQRALFTVGLPEEQYVLSLGQYFYNDAMDLVFYQRISQNYYKNRTNHLADMINEMQYNTKEWSVYSRLVYAHAYGKIREASTHFALSKKHYSLSLGHTYSTLLPDNPNTLDSNDIDVSFAYMYDDKIDVNGGFTYSLNQSSSKQWRFGIKYHVDCWSVAASLRQEIVPRPTGSTTDTNFYIQLYFAPFGSIGTGE